MIRAIVLGLALAAFAPRAHANDRTAAEAAFLKGKELEKAGRTAEACDAFSRSQQLDPQLGTQYNLARCYERLGKLASAWTLYRELAQRDSNVARRKDSADRARDLTPRLTRLLVNLEGQTPGLSVARNGADATASVGIETPVDPGAYLIEARADGYKPFTAEVSAHGEGMTVTVTIPVLEPLPAGSEQPAALPTIPAVGDDDDDEPVDDEPRPDRGRTLVGLGVAGTGVALVGTGLVFGALARATWNDARAICGGDLICDNQANLDRANALAGDARSRGNVATVLVGVGAAAIAGGVILWLTAPSGDPERDETAWRVIPSIGPGGTFVTLRGSL
jgi:tetratricopeptide (TPR) repeat protein